MISLSIFEYNYYLNDSENDSFDWVSLFALFISILTAIISVRTIYISKQEEIRYKRFEDLCLTPVQDEMTRIFEFLVTVQNETVQSHLVQINEDQRSFSLILSRIQRVFKNIDVDQMHNLYLDFSDICFNLPPEAQVSNIIEKFQVLRVDIIDHLYNNALTRKNFFGKSKNY